MVNFIEIIKMHTNVKKNKEPNGFTSNTKTIKFDSLVLCFKSLLFTASETGKKEINDFFNEAVKLKMDLKLKRKTKKSKK
jgi:hypothetical protein